MHNHIIRKICLGGMLISFQRNDKPRNIEGKPLDERSENVRSKKGKNELRLVGYFKVEIMTCFSP